MGCGARGRGGGGKRTLALRMRLKRICPRANAEGYGSIGTSSLTPGAFILFPLANHHDHSAGTSITCQRVMFVPTRDVRRLNESTEWRSLISVRWLAKANKIKQLLGITSGCSGVAGVGELLPLAAVASSAASLPVAPFCAQSWLC